MRSLTIVLVALIVSCLVRLSSAAHCNSGGLVYGEDGIVDELLRCSLGHALDLDLTPHGDQLKSTSRTLIDQGLSNKTTITHARLSGLWTARRPDFIRTGWRCDGDTISSTSIIELSGLSLEVIERLDMPAHKNQHKIAQYRPCKAFDLPTWMCRQSKPIYRTISTWVNRAYFNLTLTQRLDDTRPAIVQLTSMFTCPETFKQKITHSPSSAYLLDRHLSQASQHLSAAAPAAATHHNHHQVAPGRVQKRNTTSANYAKSHNIVEEMPSLGHPSSFTTTQSGNMPAAPPYHNSVKVIMSQVTNSLQTSLTSCIATIDSDLSLMRDHNSFGENKFDPDVVNQTDEEDERADSGSSRLGIANECSNKHWIRSRIELANQVNFLNDEMLADRQPHGGHHQHQNSNRAAKRDRIEVWHSNDPNQLLSPYGNYHDLGGSEQMIDDITSRN